MTTNILVCDDELGAFELTKSELSGEHEVRGLVGADLRRAVETLFREVRALFADEEHGNIGHGAVASAAFDDVDVAIVDNNLSALDLDGVRLTAEAIIGYLRAFTNIPYIISLNKNPDVDFDLRYLVGDYQTHADLALNTEHLSYRVLWQDGLHENDVGRDVFAPSYWPNIGAVSAVRRELIAIIERRLNDPVLEVLDFPDSSLDYLSRHAKGALGAHATTDEELSTVTCIDFFKSSCRSLPPRERTILAKRAYKPNLYAKSIARTVAADLDKWVRRDALGPQDVLVDLPHLLVRMPFLLGKDAEDAQKWNTALYSAAGLDGDDALRLFSHEATRGRIERATFSPLGIYTRWPCFWWHHLRDDDELNELFFSCRDRWADVVFCEDVSQFVAISSKDEEGTDGPKEFEAEFGGAWSRRYVKEIPKKQYSPRSRLAI